MRRTHARASSEGSPSNSARRASNPGKGGSRKAGLGTGLAGLAISLASLAAWAVPAAAVPTRAATAAPAAKGALFSGHYTGKASLLIDNGAVTIPWVTGKGTASLVGSSTVTGKGTASASAQCDPFTGTGSLSGTTGKLNLTVVQSKSSGCSSGQSGPVTVSFNGVAIVTSGTGKAKGAKGDLKFNGTLALAGTSGSQVGTYKVALSGKLTL